MFALRPIASTIFLVMLFLGAGQAFAQTYPVKLVRIVAPFAPGGGVDSIARMVAHKLTPALGQTVIVDNRPGAGGNIGIRFAAKSAPDGYTLLIMSSNFSINPSLYGNVGYDPIKDFDPVAPLTSYMLFLVCHPSMPVRSVKELIALAKNQPGKLTYASGGVGTASHFGGEMFNAATGVRMTHVPYKGTGPAITETLGGQVSIMFGVPEVVPHVKSGKLIVLGVTGAKRSAALPKVPTVAESGVPEFEVASWPACSHQPYPCRHREPHQRGGSQRIEPAGCDGRLETTRSRARNWGAARARSLGQDDPYKVGQSCQGCRNEGGVKAVHATGPLHDKQFVYLCGRRPGRGRRHLRSDLIGHRIQQHGSDVLDRPDVCAVRDPDKCPQAAQCSCTAGVVRAAYGRPHRTGGRDTKLFSCVAGIRCTSSMRRAVAGRVYRALPGNSASSTVASRS